MSLWIRLCNHTYIHTYIACIWEQMPATRAAEYQRKLWGMSYLTQTTPRCLRAPGNIYTRGLPALMQFVPCCC